MDGRLFIVSAPSGTGKTVILKEVLSRVANIFFSVSYTTRQPRKGELDGRDYYFIGQPLFQSMITEGAFLEWEDVHGSFYGTAFEPVIKLLRQGKDVLLDIDVQGTATILRERQVPATTIFIAPPTMAELEIRLRKRGSENEAGIARRLAKGRQEMTERKKYDYLVVNDVLEDAVKMTCAIIYAERSRYCRDMTGAVINLD